MSFLDNPLPSIAGGAGAAVVVALGEREWAMHAHRLLVALDPAYLGQVMREGAVLGFVAGVIGAAVASFLPLRRPAAE